VEIAAREIDASMDSERFIIVIEIPPKFQEDILAGRQPSVQINVNATAVAQAFNGMTYITSRTSSSTMSRSSSPDARD